jgi:RNA polymerase sigma-70 factor, ECF subfamily
MRVPVGALGTAGQKVLEPDWKEHPYPGAVLAVIIVRNEQVTPQQAFDEYQQAVYGFAYRLTGRSDLAEDITQECFLVLVRLPGTYNAARSSMKTFLFTIARNLALKQYRDHSAEQSIAGSEDSLAVDPRESIEISAAVAVAVSGLSVLQREALILFEYEGITLEEIAQITGTDIGTVKSRLHRARERLRRVLVAYRKAGNVHGTV